MYKLIYIYTYICRERERARETEKEREREIEKKREREGEGERGRREIGGGERGGGMHRLAHCPAFGACMLEVHGTDANLQEGSRVKNLVRRGV